MGSIIETNDTLQITREQGFPRELDLKRHLKKPYRAKDFKSKIFQFKNKPKIRIYHAPPFDKLMAFSREIGECPERAS